MSLPELVQAVIAASEAERVAFLAWEPLTRARVAGKSASALVVEELEARQVHQQAVWKVVDAANALREGAGR